MDPKNGPKFILTKQIDPMKKMIMMLVVMLGIMTVANAQNNPFKDYLGKYVFASGSPVAEVTMTAEDSSLVINSAMGSVPLEKKGVDTFYLAQYDALVIFKRASDKSVESVSIAVQGMDLVGTKEAAVASSASKEEEFQLQLWEEKVVN